MKIAFFGSFGSFDYFKIGGTESFARRLATTLVNAGHQADFIIYGSPTSRFQTAGPGIGLYSLTKLSEALPFLVKNYEHVLTLYLRPSDRLSYLRFRQRHNQRLRFHQIYFSWPDSVIKRKAAFWDARLHPFNGRLICISPRQFNYVRQWSDRAVLLVPPVWETYFLAPDTKSSHDQLRVTYIGRTEPAKGIEQVIHLLTQLKDCPWLHGEIHGFHHSHSKASVQIHEWLKDQKQFGYFYSPFESHSQELEDNLIRILKDTDILLLPYRQLSSTIDTPMLLLEGMASLCAVVSMASGSIPDIYGASPFLLSDHTTIADIITWAHASPQRLADERQRIFQRNAELGFQAQTVAARLLEAIA
jgi:glycosyltransferase involved in cell wall biosynthesis